MRSIDKVVLDAIRDLAREQRQVPATLVRHVVDLLEDAVGRSSDGRAEQAAEDADAQLMFAFHDRPAARAAGVRAGGPHGGAVRCC